jgi:threonine/homoserine/homoserine lactone efflux protein
MVANRSEGTFTSPENQTAMNIEETIAVAIGIAVGVIFLALFLFVGLTTLIP